MADLKYYDIILKPVVTEKSMQDMSNKKYVFFVHPDATKNQIREAVEKMFEGAKVDRVNTMNYKGKLRRTRTYKYGKTVARKKAIVQLKQESKEIEIFQGM
ncbi:MAG: 50S ribosomal protein L23 [Clostridiales bacterium]|jgi:large subunit ribosomal protein L23|nr:50S ribosomal protein L23 [Clostridiales bacterium]